MSAIASDMTTKTLAAWYGSDRLVAKNVGRELASCAHVTILFGGGLSVVPELGARSIVANDLHAHMINLARVCADPVLGPKLYRAVRRLPLHPGVLEDAQLRCLSKVHATEAGAGLFGGPGAMPLGFGIPELGWAVDYFVCCWMGRGGSAGTNGEFTGGASVRFDAEGGDSAARYRSAARSLIAWRRTSARCSFVCMDALELVKKVQDKLGHGIYADAPFPGPGDRYTHWFGLNQHRHLANALAGFRKTTVVCRFYDHPLVRELYQAERWRWILGKGRDRTNNDEKPEALLVNDVEMPR